VAVTTIPIPAGETAGGHITYLVPTAQAFELVSVTATFDGSGAGDAYIPVVEIYSDAGALVGRGQAPLVPLGDNAEVSFFPFGESASSSTTTGATLVYTSRGIYGSTTVSLPAGVTTIMPWTHTGGDALLDLSTPTDPVFIASGFYTVSWHLAVTGTATLKIVAGEFSAVVDSTATIMFDMVEAWPGNAVGSDASMSHSQTFQAGDTMEVAFNHDSATAVGVTFLAFVTLDAD
jgi:hypothetical protein